ncbi:MAG: hypothetical protein CFE21_14730 [Bacteroidetes bacterium B1(2017)]|nr:MAG: hypothetical protein CFE21_14730 [Bacteroidetes bacterium B1(2017)]
MALLLVISCSHYDQLSKNPVESKSGGRSHNSGENCGKCHNSHNNGEFPGADKWWTVAGTIYASNFSAQKNAVIELYEKTGKQGKLIKRLVSDNNGNFYTNQIIDFNNGCYPVVTVGSNSKMMNQGYIGGSCNSCHGITTASLVVN